MPMERALASQDRLLKGVVMVPNVTSPMQSIESRAESIAEKVERISKKYDQKVHVIAHSFAGVDVRCAISMMGLKSSVQSLTTLCSPHHGLTLIDKSRRFP